MKKITTTVTVSILALTTIVTQALANQPMRAFTDVDASNLYLDSIEYLAANDIVGGYADGTFKPEKTLNRAEMMKILVEGQITLGTTMKEDVELYGETKCFNDVKTGEWYAKYVCHAKAAGWVQGYENGKLFKPEQEVTFVEALKMTMKAFEISYDEEANPWYKDAVDIAGVYNFIPIDIDAFELKLHRDQMADLLNNVLKSILGQEYGFSDSADFFVTYETIAAGRNLLQEFLDQEGDDDTSKPVIDDVEDDIFSNATIEITAKGFSPETITISQGDTVTFINKDIEKHWPASAIHPTHKKYPGSGIDKCGTLDEYYIFDACHGLEEGEEYSFPFDEVGTWKYHDHLNPEIKGTIIVE